MSTFYIGIKLGSTSTCIYKPGNGIVLEEASLIAMPKNLKIRDVKAVGSDAKKLIGRTSDNISVFSPILNGTIHYEELAIYMLKGFLKKVFPNKSIGQNIKAILSVPMGLSAEEKKHLEITCFKAGIADVYLVPDIINYALGSGININEESAKFIVNIGGHTTNIGIISNLQIIKGYNFSIGGSLINVALKEYIENKYNIFISYDQVEKLKTEIATLFENYNASMEIIGVNKNTQAKEHVIITSNELYPITSNYYGKIADAINSIFQSADPEAIADISKNGIYFYGGGTKIIGLEQFMAEKTNLKIILNNLSKSNLYGTGELIKYPQLLKKVLKNN